MFLNFFLRPSLDSFPRRFLENWVPWSEGLRSAILANYNNHSSFQMFFFFRGRGPNGEAVLHTMYMDGACSRKWGDILRISKSDVDRELKRTLEYKFRRKVPDPLDTVYQYWDEGAW